VNEEDVSSCHPSPLMKIDLFINMTHLEPHFATYYEREGRSEAMG